MTPGLGYLTAYFNGNAGMLLGNNYAGNGGHYFAGNPYVETNGWGEAFGYLTAFAIPTGFQIWSMARADKQASVPTETAADYDSKISAKESEITTALSALGLDTDFGKIKDSTTAADLVPDSYSSAVTKAQEGVDTAQNSVNTAEAATNTNEYLKNQIIAEKSEGDTVDGKKLTLSDIIAAKKAVKEADDALEKANKELKTANEKLEKAKKEKTDKEAAIEAKLPNIKKLIGEYNSLVKAQEKLQKSEKETETARMTKEVMDQKHFKPDECKTIWDDGETNFKTGLEEKDLRKAYSTAIQNFISAEGNNKALWAHRAVALLDSNKIDMTKLNSSQRAMIEQVRKYAAEHQYEKPQPEITVGEILPDNYGGLNA